VTALDDRGWRGVVETERTLFDAATDAEMLAPETIEARFQAFHAAHPEVYTRLRIYALELVNAGWEHFGISVVWERVRYETMLGAHAGEDSFKLNDHFRSRYARLLIDQEPRLAEVFTTRQLRSASKPPVCGSCATGTCRHCLGHSCAHRCDVR